MCIQLTSTRYLKRKKPLTVWKLVRAQGKYACRPMFESGDRGDLQLATKFWKAPGHRGWDQTFTLGETHRSNFPRTIGFSFFPTRREAELVLPNWAGRTLARCTIPAGTRYLRGTSLVFNIGMDNYTYKHAAIIQAETFILNELVAPLLVASYGQGAYYA